MPSLTRSLGHSLRWSNSVQIQRLGEFKSLGIEFLSHQVSVDTSTPAGRMLFQVIGAMAEFEREIIRERVIAGIKMARQKGTKLGRPRLEFDYETARDLRKQGLSFRAIASRLGVSVGSVHSALKGWPE